MELRRLGRTDLRVSALCLGTMTFGQQNSESEGHEQLDYALLSTAEQFRAAGAEQKPASWARSPTCKGARSGPFACRRRKFFVGYAGVISPVSGSTPGSSDGAGSLRRRAFDCLRR